MRRWIALGLMVFGVGGCASLDISGIDWQSLSERFSRQEVQTEIQPRKIEHIQDTQERQKILESPRVSGVAERLKKQKVIVAEKQQQQATVEPLVQRLRSMSEPEVLEMLGQPTRQIRQGQVNIWQYVAERCQWDLYFRENQEGQLPVLHDLIVHHRGNIITDTAQIAQCEAGLLQKQSV